MAALPCKNRTVAKSSVEKGHFLKVNLFFPIKGVLQAKRLWFCLFLSIRNILVVFVDCGHVYKGC